MKDFRSSGNSSMITVYYNRIATKRKGTKYHPSGELMHRQLLVKYPG